MMRIELSDKVQYEYDRAPVSVRRAFNKCLVLLVRNLRHPSLHAKKYDETRDIWQARVTKGWSFYFKITGDTYYLITMIPHPK